MTESENKAFELENLQHQRMLLASVEADPNQPRKDFEPTEMERLLESFSRDGQIVPVLVYAVEGKFRLADGERRWRTARKLNWEYLNAIVLPSKPDAATLLKMQIAANCVRTDFSLRDRLANCNALKEQCGMSHDEIGRMLNVGKSTISRILSLKKLDEAEWKRIENGELGLEAAYHLTKVKQDQRKEALEAVCNGKAGREQLRSLSKKSSTKSLNFVLGGAVTIVRSPTKLDVDELLDHMAALTKVLRRAKRQGLDSATLVKVLEDQAAKEEVTV